MASKEVRVLTATFEGLARELRMEVGVSEWKWPDDKGNVIFKPQFFRGLWDTGASSSTINKRVVDECNLSPIGLADVQTARGLHTRTEVYGVNIYLPSHVTIGGIRATLGDLGSDLDVLIGMDVITTGDFAVTNANKRTVMSFRFPSLEHIDFGKQNKTNPPNPHSAPITKVDRNDP